VSVKRILIVPLVLVGLLLGGWLYLAYDGLGDVPVPEVPPEGTPPPDHTGTGHPTWAAGHGALQEARRLCSLPPLDEFVVSRRALADPVGRGEHLHVLAEALLERIYCRNSHRGMTPGEPMYSHLPAPIKADIEEGLAALGEARSLGVELGDGYRVEAGLKSSRITSRISALRAKGGMNKAYKRSLELDGKNPHLHVALGCTKLLAPSFLGQDVEKAMEHFVYACRELPDDERPRIFASMAAWLSDDRKAALDWADKAVQINPNNAFAQVVLQRLRAGEADPFGRDI
jgi:hypothetical protein